MPAQVTPLGDANDDIYTLSPLYIYEHTLFWMINQGDPPV